MAVGAVHSNSLRALVVPAGADAPRVPQSRCTALQQTWLIHRELEAQAALRLPAVHQLPLSVLFL